MNRSQTGRKAGRHGGRRALLSLAVLLAIACIPIPATLKDGGTRNYSALLYRVIVWHRLAGGGGGYSTGVEVQLFPRNVGPLQDGPPPT
ncbi:MAG TPA: hypothetical protein H9674_00250 [Firmicutes bacterium]|nr:hypothetical protein [Bacillota bacterium]